MSTASRPPHGLPPQALLVIRAQRSVALFIPAVVIVFGVTCLVGSSPVLGIASLVVATAFVAGWWWWTGAAFRAVRWGVDAETVRLWSGVVVTRQSVLPRARVQNVTVSSGPLQRFKGVSTMTVHSAGAHTPDIVIAHLADADVELVRTALLPSERGPQPAMTEQPAMTTGADGD